MNHTIPWAVMVSIKPRHTANIKSRKKSLEVRKTVPSISNPFKVYVYETKDGSEGAGAVVCEFVCDYIAFMQNPFDGSVSQEDSQAACLTEKEIQSYARGRTVYGWHISELKLYDEPIPLNKFVPRCQFMLDDMPTCDHKAVGCPYQNYDYNPEGSLNTVTCLKLMKRPPQSWCYVLEVHHEA